MAGKLSAREFVRLNSRQQRALSALAERLSEQGAAQLRLDRTIAMTHRAIVTALAAGVPVKAVAGEASLSVSRIYRIKEETLARSSALRKGA